MAIFLMACTANDKAKNWGGTETIYLKPNEKFLNATWKDTHLWYTTTEMDSAYMPKTYKFHEKSNLGMLEGTIIFVESKK